MRSSKQPSFCLPVLHPAALSPSTQAAAAAVQLEGETVAVLVEPVVDTQVLHPIAVAGRSGVEEVYGVPYLDVGCDVWFDV
jgi:hypothetical protein